ncbi:hypothetical protein BDW62DRAFT_186948, partial [Aspergillus aurantiobrunneus]
MEPGAYNCLSYYLCYTPCPLYPAAVLLYFYHGCNAVLRGPFTALAHADPALYYHNQSYVIQL